MTAPADPQAHVLVVDDDDRLRALLQKFLSRNGFWVTPARDARRIYHADRCVAHGERRRRAGRGCARSRVLPAVVCRAWIRFGGGVCVCRELPHGAGG